jgi:hypothetical protein
MQLAGLPDSSESFASLFTALYRNGEYFDLRSYYMAFLKDSLSSLSDGSMNFKYEKNNDIKRAVEHGTELKFELDASGSPVAVSEPTEGSAALTFAGSYSTGFYKFTTNCDTTLTITPDSTVFIYRFDWKDKDSLGYNLFTPAAPGQPTEIEFGKNDFILIAQVCDTPNAIGFKYSAAPVKTDITGRWNFTDFYYTDMEASANVWNEIQSVYGKDEQTILNEGNKNAQEMIKDFHLYITQIQPGQYKVDFYFGSEQLTFSEAQYDNGNLIAKWQYTEGGDTLWVNINVNIVDDSMSGVYRIQMSFTTEEGGTATFTLVADITLQQQPADMNQDSGGV